MIVMLKKRDLFDKWGKRLCALFLSAEMALGSVSGMVLNVHAASNIRFEFQTSTGRNTSTEIVAGTEIPIFGTVPSGYNVESPYFHIARGDENVDNVQFFDSEKNSDRQWTVGVDVRAGDAHYDKKNDDGSISRLAFKSPSSSYSLNGILSSTTVEQGKVNITSDYVTGEKNITSDEVIGITERGGFKFKLRAEIKAEKEKQDDGTEKITGYKIDDVVWFYTHENKLNDNPPEWESMLEQTSGWFRTRFPHDDPKVEFLKDKIDADTLRITLTGGNGPARTFTIKDLKRSLQEAAQREMLKDKPDDLLKIVMTFDAIFDPPEGNAMIMTVHKPVTAVTKIATSLQSPETAIDDFGNKIITVANGDSLTDPDIGISRNFTARTNITRYNSNKYRIEWSWVPKGNLKERKLHENVVIFQKKDPSPTVLVQPEKESVDGYLVARVFYTPMVQYKQLSTATPFTPDQRYSDKKEGDKFDGAELEWTYEGKITPEILRQGDSLDSDTSQKATEFKEVRATAVFAVRILGTGTAPEVKFEKAFTGGYNKATGKQYDADVKDIENTNGLKLDVYDGGTDTEIYKTPPEAPYKFEGHLWFGTLGSRADRLVVEHISTDGGEVELYNTQTETKYAYGAEILNEAENKNGQWSIPFRLQAVHKGNVKLKFNFYNREGNIIPGATGVYDFNITIVDNRPDPDPSLKQLDMKIYYGQNGVKLGQETLTSLTKNFPGDLVDYGFNSEQREYGSAQDPILLPNAVQQLTFWPSYSVDKNENNIIVTWVRGSFIDSGLNEMEIPDDKESKAIPQGDTPKEEKFRELEVGYVYTIRFECTAETGDKTTYTIYVKREEASNDAALESLEVFPNRQSETPYPMEPEFDPERYRIPVTDSQGNPTDEEDNYNAYVVRIPYSQESVNIKVRTRNHWASKIDIFAEKDRPATVNFLSRVRLNLQYKPTLDKIFNMTDVEPETAKRVIVQVTPENGDYPREYVVDLYREAPSKNSRIQEPKVSYWLNNQTLPSEENPVEIDGFDVEIPNIFAKRVPYSANRFKIIITPEDYLAKRVTIRNATAGEQWEIKDKDAEDTDKSKKHTPKDGEPQPVQFMIEDAKKLFDANNRLEIQVRVDPEDPELQGKGQVYSIHLEREEPNTDVTANITLTNMLTNAQVTPDEGFDYNNIVDEYDVEIEYTPGNMQLLIQVEPTAPTTIVDVKIGDKDFQVPRPDGTLAKLTAGQTTIILVRLTAEDGKTIRTVKINVKYLNPSTNCYLKDLKAGTLLFRPIPTPFDKKKLNYKIEIPKGMTTIPITAWLLDDGSKDDSSKATITINDKKVGNGEAYNFTPSEKTGKIKVVVTAQDGKTKRTYTISYKNWNMLKPDDEDMLKDLWVDYADMHPKFDSSITEYEVYLKPEAMDIKVYPKLRDESCKIEVTAESKVLTEFEDYYSTSLMDDEMDIHVYVWSEQAIVNNMSDNATGAGAAGGGTATVLPDKEENPPRTTAREYILHLYRNDDEKIGNFKPLPAEDVDFVSSDPIVIDITQYPIISADVFKTLKEDYPDKSIIFKGNDYTLQIFGADIDGVIPNVESFDLRFSFRTPDEKKIRDAMDAAGNNSHIEPVYYYFNQHGALPAEMLLTVDLGRHYSNETLFWNYYNQERDRIDYYGYVHTNAKGTFSVPISHFSTYLSTDEKIRGAENKSDEYGNPIPLTEETENLNSASSANKDIPNTAAPISFTVPSLNQTSAAQQPVRNTSPSAGSAAVQGTTPIIDMALPERKKLSPVRKKSAEMPTGILK